MTAPEDSAEQHVRTVILIGGAMKLDDGTGLDSRQPIEGDPDCSMMRRCLAGSMLWWLTVSSLVDRILDDSGPDAFALIIGLRTLLDVQPDGSVRRTRTGKVLRGGVSTVELVRTGTDESLDTAEYERAGEMDRNWSGAHMGDVGLRYSKPRRRWRALNGNEWYLRQAGPALHPTVIVDTTDSLFHDMTFQSLEQRRLFSDQVLVMPHTRASERCVDGYIARKHGETPLPPLHSSAAWDPSAPPDPVRSAIPVPIEASFGVTALMQSDEWRDPSDLEAARKLLQARFDLRIGLWDLVRNPLLRRTLIDAVPTSPAPTQAAPVPPSAAKRARNSINTRVASMEAEAIARNRIDPLLKPLLREGWKLVAGGTYRLELSELVPWRWNADEFEPLAFLTLHITKRTSSVVLGSRFGEHPSALDVSALAGIAWPADSDLGSARPPVFWREPGGWADDVDWVTRANELVVRTKNWRDALQDFISACRHRYQQDMTKIAEWRA